MKIRSIKLQPITISKFFEEEAASLWIPTIQRRFVWTPERIKEMINSMINGYPIGSIIIWEPVTKFPGVPLEGDEKIQRTYKYIIDGQQRLASLMLIRKGWENRKQKKESFLGWEIKRGDDFIKIDQPISYNPDKKELYVSARRGIDISLLVNASLGEADALEELKENWPATYRKGIEEAGRKIINYILPFYFLESDTGGSSEDTYEKVADIFVKVNSAGVRLGNLEMFLSFFGAPFGELKGEIVAMHKEFSRLYKLDLEPIVRFIFSRMKLTQNQITNRKAFKRAIGNLKEKYTKNALRTIIEKARKSVETVMQMLNEEAGVSTTQFIPSENALIPLFAHIFEDGYRSAGDISKSERNKMQKWFLIASFNGIYSGSPNRKIEDDLEIFGLKDMIKT